MGWVGHGPATSASEQKPAYLENALAFVDTPGEWYLDPKTRKITYQALAGEDPNARTFYAPRLEQWIVVAGGSKARVRNLHFLGLSFQHTAWSRPAFGYNGIQAGHYGTTTEEPTYVLPAAIEFTFAEACSVTNCTLSQTGGAGSPSERVRGVTPRPRAS